jgi:hypothetical protein
MFRQTATPGDSNQDLLAGGTLRNLSRALATLSPGERILDESDEVA